MIASRGSLLQTHRSFRYLPANWLNSTHPETLFTQHLIAMRRVEPHELDAVLRERFGLDRSA